MMLEGRPDESEDSTNDTVTSFVAVCRSGTLCWHVTAAGRFSRHTLLARKRHRPMMKMKVPRKIEIILYRY
jgi:hypothetical protein